MNNAVRIKRARRTLAAYKDDAYGVVQAEFEPDPQAITDLVTDLLHLAKDMGIDPLWRVESAVGHFRTEVGA
jgi:hypothetical protein